MKSVLNRVPQGSVLRPLLFLIRVYALVLTFTEGTKLFKKVNTDRDKQHLQDDLDKLFKWSEKKADVIKCWEMTSLNPPPILVLSDVEYNKLLEEYGPRSRCFRHQDTWYTFDIEAMLSPPNTYGSGCYKVRNATGSDVLL